MQLPSCPGAAMTRIMSNCGRNASLCTTPQKKTANCRWRVLRPLSHTVAAAGSGAGNSAGRGGTNPSRNASSLAVTGGIPGRQREGKIQW
jgi:hypothetical protein